MTLPMRRLGSGGPSVSAIALGCMGMSGMYGPSDDAESIATIHAAIDAGINLLDTGDFYGMGHNEMLIGRALDRRREKVLLSVKFGAMRGPDGAFIGIDTRPVAVRNFVAYTLKRLNTDYIDIYRPARLDPRVPIEETVGAIADLVKQGYVRYVGLSEMGADTIRRAQAVHPITDVQLEYSLISRGIEQSILPAVRQLGIGVTAYGVLSRGLLTGSQPSGKSDFRAHLPRFTGANYETNRQLVNALEEFGKTRGASVAQIALGWALAKGDDIIPVVGVRTRRQLQETLSALEIKLSPQDIMNLEAICSPGSIAGTRYDAGQMRMLDSERS